MLRMMVSMCHMFSTGPLFSPAIRIVISASLSRFVIVAIIISARSVSPTIFPRSITPPRSLGAQAIHQCGHKSQKQDQQHKSHDSRY